MTSGDGSSIAQLSAVRTPQTVDDVHAYSWLRARVHGGEGGALAAVSRPKRVFLGECSLLADAVLLVSLWWVIFATNQCERGREGA